MSSAARKAFMRMAAMTRLVWSFFRAGGMVFSSAVEESLEDKFSSFSIFGLGSIASDMRFWVDDS